MAANEDIRAARGAPDPYLDEQDEEELFEDEQPPKRTSRILPIVVASLAILGFVVIVYYAYQQGIRAGSEQNPPIIKAEEGPTKVRPASPGGMDVPNQGMKVYELGKPGAQTAAGGPERILPKPEEPLQRPKEPQAAPEPAPAQQGAAPSAGVVPAIPGSAAGNAAALSANLPPLSMITGTPLAAGAVTTPPPPPVPGTGLPTPAAPLVADAPPAPAAKPPGPAVPAPPPPAAPPRDNAPTAAAPAQRGIALGAPRPAAPTPLQQQATIAAPAAPAAPPAPAAPTAPAAPPAPAAAPQAAVPPIAAAPAGGGSYRVQIVAAKTEAEAQQFWQTAVRKHRDLLGSLGMETQAIDVPGKGTLIRVLVGPLASKTEADKLCAGLRARNQDCIVR